MTMNDSDSLAEVKATLAISDFNRRERLLGIIRGKPEWRYYAFAAFWFVFISYMMFRAEMDSGTVFLALIPLLLTIVGAYVDCSRRMNALIELIGEENLRNTKTNNKEQKA